MSEFLNIILKESDDDLNYDDPDFTQPDDLKEEPEEKPLMSLRRTLYPCHKCSKLFTSKFNLNKHMSKDCNPNETTDWITKTENGKRIYFCKKCPLTFPTVRELQIHRKEHLPKEYVEYHYYSFDDIQELYVCNTCSAEFKDEEEAKKHVKGHSEIFDCRFCEEKFQTLFQLGSHIKTTHSDDGQFSCPLCPDQQFSKASHFMKHVAIKHQKRYMYNCPECGRGFHSKTLCREHQNVHKGIKPFVCVVCNAGFTYSKSVVTHQLKAHRVEILGKSHATECTFCRHRFVTVASLERHVLQCHGTPKPPKEKIHLCDICGMGFVKKNKLVVHQRVHTGVKPYPCRFPTSINQEELQIKDESTTDEENKNEIKCKKCPETFSTITQLKQHRKLHKNVIELPEHTYKLDTLQDLYICCTCSAEFQKELEVKQHVKDFHENEYCCSQCPKTFQTLLQVARHSGKHDPEGRMSCSLCPFQTLKKSTLHTHINGVHLKKFLYFCPTCGKGFNDQLLFKEHANEHLGARPFACIVCGKSFTYSRYLTTHQIRNHRVNIEGTLLPNQCPVCSKRYSKPESLEKHLKEIHLKKGPHEKKHLCDTCGKGFATRSKLVVHERVHTGYKPYACTCCGKCFTKRDYLDQTYQIGKVSALRLHTMQQNVQNSKCNFCSTTSSSESAIKVHLTEHATSCNTCLLKFENIFLLGLHMAEHDDSERIFCPSCDFSGKLPALLKKHISSNHFVVKVEENDEDYKVSSDFVESEEDEEEEKPKKKSCLKDVRRRTNAQRVCKVCNKEFTTAKDLKNHKKVHKAERLESLYKFNAVKETYTCDTCLSEFETKDQILEHVEVHTFTCPVCSQKFKKALLMGLHMAEHNPEDFISCPICNHEFKTRCKSRLARHIRQTHQKERPKTSQCEYCGSSYLSKTMLEDHIRVVHLKKEPSKCIVCGSTFTLQSSMRIHQINKHRVVDESELPSNYCTLCKMTFKKPSSLEKHLEMKRCIPSPRVERQGHFICDLCGKEFRFFKTFKLHLREHAGDKPYKCSFCPKSFVINSKRLAHEVSHTDSRPFSCESCGQSYKTWKHLRRHLVIHGTNPKASFNCSFCGKEFANKDTQRGHMKKCSRPERPPGELFSSTFGGTA
ncbi:zinc finger protein 208-like [Anthonomus grandis grandis]|uniref:zinc finger protein 208-like n=1 Tax=Anthonomus grandis grandis TaxID=2921223 RepID=UPI00216681A5|nr:zinc finger protein 208-like [Anthonomus grandis grandis]